MAGMAFRTIWIIFYPFSKASSAVLSHRLMPLMYSKCSVACPFPEQSGSVQHKHWSYISVSWAAVSRCTGISLNERKLWPALCAKGIEKNLQYWWWHNFAAWYSNSYWSSTMSGTAAFSGGVTSFRPLTVYCQFHSPSTGLTHWLLKSEEVLLTSPWLSSSGITSWMGVTGSWLEWYCQHCTVVVAIGTCSSIFSGATAERCPLRQQARYSAA